MGRRLRSYGTYHFKLRSILVADGPDSGACRLRTRGECQEIFTTRLRGRMHCVAAILREIRIVSLQVGY